MIFITVGTERFPFDRLLRAIDQMQDILEGELVFAQTGSGNYKPSCPQERYLSYSDFRNKLQEARIVVSHAGAGTLLMCKEMRKVPIMMARRKFYGEHVDDHQKMLAERMAERQQIILAKDPGDIIEKIVRYDELFQSGSREIDRQQETELVKHIAGLLDGFAEQVSS